MKDRKCPNCGRTVQAVNYHEEIATCIFCDLNKNGGEA